MAGCCAPGVSQVEEPRLRRILWVALVANAVMFVVEVIAGFLSNSVALQADALDFFGDAVNYGITLVVLGLALRARSIAALIKAATMALFGMWVIGMAVYRAFGDTVPDAPIMGGVAVLALLVNVVVAMMLYRYRGGDSNTRSIWLCSRNDAISNVAVLVAASGVYVSASGWPDIAVAAVIASLSLSAAYQVFVQASGELRHDHASESA
ncbi:MAG: cation diffusion facilitator family transporter [Gammaproteobacteria bacterium]|jgi:cation diffusion facilitator family transporter